MSLNTPSYLETSGKIHVKTLAKIFGVFLVVGIPSALVFQSIYKRVKTFETQQKESQLKLDTLQKRVKKSVRNVVESTPANNSDIDYDVIGDINVQNNNVKDENTCEFENEERVVLEEVKVEEKENNGGGNEKIDDKSSVLTEEEQNLVLIDKEILEKKMDIIHLAFGNSLDVEKYTVQHVGVNAVGDMIVYKNKPMVKRLVGKMVYFLYDDKKRLIEFNSDTFIDVYVLVTQR